VPRATKEQSEATAAAVLSSARELFTERGYAAVGLEEVAAAAGVTRGAVYHHYGSKAALFEAVHEAVQQEVAAAIEAATDGIEDPWAGLEVGSRAFLDASVADGRRRIMLVDGPAVLGWSQWRDADARNAVRHLDEVLAELAGSGFLAVGSVPAASVLLSGAMNAAAMWIAGADDRDAASAAAWATLRPMLAAIRAPGSDDSSSGAARYVAGSMRRSTTR
jgi:AcrR family transcriptional regulator